MDVRLPDWVDSRTDPPTVWVASIKIEIERGHVIPNLRANKNERFRLRPPKRRARLGSRADAKWRPPFFVSLSSLLIGFHQVVFNRFIGWEMDSLNIPIPSTTTRIGIFDCLWLPGDIIYELLDRFFKSLQNTVNSSRTATSVQRRFDSVYAECLGEIRLSWDTAGLNSLEKSKKKPNTCYKGIIYLSNFLKLKKSDNFGQNHRIKRDTLKVTVPGNNII